MSEKKKNSNPITEAIVQSNVTVVGNAPAMGMGETYQTNAHSTGLLFTNAVNNQNQQFILGQTAGVQGQVQLNSKATIADALAIARALNGSGDLLFELL